MKDLDFDELDRAVNSLMTNTSKTPPPPKKDTEQTLTITPTLSDDTAPSLDTLDAKMSQINGRPPASTALAPISSPAPVSVTVPTPEPVRSAPTSVASRRGRFMDMVRPAASQSSSKDTSVDTSGKGVSRQGSTIHPSGPLMTDVIAPSSNSQARSNSNAAATSKQSTPDLTHHYDKEPDTAPATSNDTNSDAADSAWPDPLDMMIDTAVKKDATSEAAPSAAVSPPKTSSFVDDIPLSSPFLPDTQVEKRPLGGTQLLAAGDEEKLLETGEEDAAAIAVDAPPKTDQRSEKQLPPNPSEAKDSVSLPEELSGDVMALESDANTMAMPVASEKAAAVADQASAMQSDDTDVEPNVVAEKPVELTPAPKEDVSSLHDTTANEPVSQPSIPTGPISIPQQYREEPSTGDKSNGAIYDTDTYHQPLAHPKKKKTGWMWVVWIVLFLVVGAAGGAALYFLGIF